MKEQILEDLKNAMKSKNKEELMVIRMLKGAIQMEELNKKKELNDEEIISIVAKQIKIRKESINEFTKGDRQDLIENAENEIKILEKYLPKQLTKEEALAVIEKAFKEINPTSIKDMGKIMKQITPEIKGRYDMQEVSQIIKNRLS